MKKLLFLALVCTFVSCSDIEIVETFPQEDFEEVKQFYDILIESEVFEIPQSLQAEVSNNPGFYTYLEVIKYCVNMPVFWDTIAEGDSWDIFYNKCGYKYM